MRTRSIFVVLAAMALGSLAQAGEVTAPPLSGLLPADAGVTRVDVMFANLQATDPQLVQGTGRVIHSIWYNQNGSARQAYRAIVEIQVPIGVPGLDSLMAVLGADVRISLSTNGVPYAECMLPLQLVSSRSTAIFELHLGSRRAAAIPHRGVCDIDLDEPGIQIGIPEMHFQDLIETIIWADDGSPGRRVMEGYCY